MATLKEATALRKAKNLSKKKASKKKAKPRKKKKAAKKSLEAVSEPKGAVGHNLNGRPKGVKNKTTIFKECISGGWEEMVLKDAKAVFKVLGDKAKEGDMQAIKMFLDRAVPVTKAVDINAADLSAKGGITIHIEKLVTETKKGDTIEDGIVID